MKKQLIKVLSVMLAVTMIAIVVTCNGTEKESKDSVLSVIPSDRDIELSADGVSATSYGESITPTFTVETNQNSWDVKPSHIWVKAIRSGNQFTLSANRLTDSSAPEPAEVIITAGKTSIKIRVKQSVPASVPVLSVDPPDRNIVLAADGINATSNGEPFTPTFTVATNQSLWDVKPSHTWVKVNRSGNQFTLSADPLTAFTAPDPAKVTVTAGEAATVEIDVQQSVPVQIPISGISVSESSVNLFEGEIKTFNVTLMPENHTERGPAAALRWESSDPNVATVKGVALGPLVGGELSAVGEGSAVITVSLQRDPLIKADIPVAVAMSDALKGDLAVPNIKGYITLKCDFHTHTMYSDGTITPVRLIDEAYREGLDAIAITDHIEDHAHWPEVRNTSRNLSYELALPRAEKRGMILIRGGEITRDMPPGHCNAIFLTDADLLNVPDIMDAFLAAKAQGAFFFWNHPGSRNQGFGQPTTEWWPIHTQLLEQGMMHGIEVASTYYESYPEAQQWCLDKNLTMFGNSDQHGLLSPLYRRTMTLVFASSATPEAIREALEAGRTAAWYNADVIGEEKYLMELFENALEWTTSKAGNVVNVKVKNNSDMTFRLKNTSNNDIINIAKRGEQNFSIEGDAFDLIVENFLVKPNEGMKYTFKIKN